MAGDDQQQCHYRNQRGSNQRRGRPARDKNHHRGKRQRQCTKQGIHMPDGRERGQCRRCNACQHQGDGDAQIQIRRQQAQQPGKAPHHTGKGGADERALIPALYVVSAGLGAAECHQQRHPHRYRHQHHGEPACGPRRAGFVPRQRGDHRCADQRGDRAGEFKTQNGVNAFGKHQCVHTGCIGCASGCRGGGGHIAVVVIVNSRSRSIVS